jgi:pimeloyl-ACP methyl ester carboxylesterase
MKDLGRAQMAATAPQVLHGDFVACDGFDAIGRLSEVTVPCLVVCGSKDRMTPREYSTYLQNNIKGAVLCLVEGAGHMVPIEAPQAVSQALSSLLAKIPRAHNLRGPIPR